MDTLLSMKVFCQVVQSGSFTRAAELLDVSIPMASKHVAHLEKNIGIQLLYRNNRTLKLTEQGEAYYRDCLKALMLLEQAADKAASNTQPCGTLRISAPVWFACDKFAQTVQRYQEKYPHVELVLSLTNRHVDLNSDGEDLALRLSHNLAENIIAKPLGNIPFYLMASPAFLAKYKTPTHPNELIDLPAILPTYTDASHRTAYHQDTEAIFSLNGHIRSNNTLMVATLIRAGNGIGYIPSWLVEDDIKQGKLVRLLPEYSLPIPPLYAVYASHRSMNPRIRSFIDFMTQECQTSQQAA